MERSDILSRISEILRKTMADSQLQIREESYILDELGLSSMDVLMVMAEIEDEFQIKIKEDEMTEFIQVKDLIDCIEKKL